MRGRRPKPTAIKQLEGNPGKRRLNLAEPTPPRTAALFDATPPPQLRDEQSIAIWRELAPQLFATGMVSDIDRPMLIMACSYFGQWERTFGVTVRAGEVFRTANGKPQANPYNSVAKHAALLFRAFGIELGLSPTARARLHAEHAPGGRSVDDFAEFFDAPPGLTDDDDTDATH